MHEDVVRFNDGVIQDEAKGVGFVIIYPRDTDKRIIIFKEKSDALHFEALLTEDDRRDYLIHVFNRNLMQHFADDIELLANVFARPSDFEKYEAGRVMEAMKTFLRIENRILDVVDTIYFTYPLQNVRGARNNWLALEDMFRSRNPLLGLYYEKKKAFQERLAARAAEFIVFADRLPDEKRRLFIEFLDFAGEVEKRVSSPGRNVAVETIPAALKEAGLIGLKEKKRPGRRPQAVQLPEAQILNDNYIEINLADWEAPHGPPADKEPNEGSSPKMKKGRVADVETRGRRGQGERNDEEIADRQKYKYRISPRTMIDFILKFPHNVVVSRWSPQLSRELARMNEDGSYDGRIESAYPDIIRNYPEAERVVTNPLYSPISEAKIPHSLLGEELLGRGSGPIRTDLPLIPADFEPILRPIAQRRNAALVAQLEKGKDFQITDPPMLKNEWGKQNPWR